MGLPGLTGDNDVLVLHLLHLLAAAAGTYLSCLWRPDTWTMSLPRDCEASAATNWFIRGAEEDLLRQFFIASSTYNILIIHTY